MSCWSTAIQFGKFLVVGTLNTAIDFGTLNLLSWFTGIYGGVRLAPINVLGVLLALTNSYLLNKHWTFKTPAHPRRRYWNGGCRQDHTAERWEALRWHC